MQIEKPRFSLYWPPIFVLLALAVFVYVVWFFSGESRKPALHLKPSLQPDIETSVEKQNKVPEDLTLPPETIELPETKTPETFEQIVPEQEGSLLPEPSGELPPAFLTSFFGDVKIMGSDGEVKPEKKMRLLEGQTIEVGAAGEVVLEIEELYILRLKPNTRLGQLPPKIDKLFSGKSRTTYRYKLEKGSLLGTTKFRGDKVNMLALEVGEKTFNIQDSTFRVQMTDAMPWIGVLRGSVKSEVEKSGDEPLTIRALEKLVITDAEAPQTVQVSEEEWGLLRETYEMNQKTALQEAAQIDLSKEAGDFFGYVFDHGTFYTENAGYAVRDFYEDRDSGDVYLEAEYDVFPSHSFVGLYVLTRDLNARDYGGIKFDVRRKPEEGYPDRFFIELKSKGDIIKKFEITDIKPEWEGREIHFFNPISTPITEVTLVFLNDNIGASKKGYIQMRNIQMMPLNNEQKIQLQNPPQVASSAVKSIRPYIPRPLPSRQSIETEITTPVEHADDDDNGVPEVPYQLDESRKIADEVPKLVSFEDLSE